MRVIKKVVFTICISFVFLTGCGGKLRSGEIFNKEFFPEKTTIVLVPVTHTKGKSSHTVFIPMTYHYPDRWRIDIKSLNPDRKGKYKTASYWVTEEVYEDCTVGGMFEYDNGRDFLSEPVEKEKGEETSD